MVLSEAGHSSASSEREATSNPMIQPLTVSIVISNYNYSHFVAEAIDSALAQTYPNIEVIVVDDGSTDNSRQVIKSREDKIRAIFKANGGHGSAINAGFAASTGNLVMFLDSDDVLRPNAIETVVREWGPNTARILLALEHTDTNGKSTGRVIGGEALPSPVLGSFGVGSPTSGNVFSRDALERIIPMPEALWKTCPDYYLVAAGLFGEIKGLRQPLVKYRVHGNNDHLRADPLFVIRHRLHLDLILYDTLVQLTGGKIASLRKWLGTCPEHWVYRIASLREKPEDHPWPDSLSGLTAQAIMATWRQPGRNFRRRLAYTVFALGYATLPKKATRIMGEIERGERRLAFRRLLGGRKPVGAGNY